MKLVSVAFFALTLLLSLRVPVAGLFFAVFFGAVFGAYGIVGSFSERIDPLNDVPNALRVFLASLGGYFVTLSRTFFFPSAGVILLVAALYLNDEFQRRVVSALRQGKRGGTIALLGIDGSGKSSHSMFIARWLEERGYACTVMPFHKYLFVERLAAIFSAGGSRGEGGERFRFRRGGNPIRPLASLLDNLILQFSSSVGCRLEGRVVIYDRFIWSTYVKYKALGYPVKTISGLYLSPKPTSALVLNVPVDRSLKVIQERVSHIHYPREVLESERQEYLGIAKVKGYPVIDATAPFAEVQEKIESHLDRAFPRKGGGARAG